MENKKEERIQLSDNTYMTRFIQADRVMIERFYKDNKFHNNNGPAYVEYDASGRVTEEQFHINGKMHREDGPAFRIFIRDSDLFSHGFFIEQWFYEGFLHRLDGPAKTPLSFEMMNPYFLENQQYSKENYYKVLKEVEEMPLALKLIDPRKWVRRMGIENENKSN